MQRRIHKSMRKRVLTGLFCLVFLSGCASGAESGVSEEQTEEMLPLSEEEPQEEKMFGAVSYFDEDTDGLLQYADGYLYGYLGGHVFRVDAETGEASVLFETAGTRSIHFCIDNDKLYFLMIPQITFINGTKANLYRMNCDGSGCWQMAA